MSINNDESGIPRIDLKTLKDNYGFNINNGNFKTSYTPDIGGPVVNKADDFDTTKKRSAAAITNSELNEGKTLVTTNRNRYSFTDQRGFSQEELSSLKSDSLRGINFREDVNNLEINGATAEQAAGIRRILSRLPPEVVKSASEVNVYPELSGGVAGRAWGWIAQDIDLASNYATNEYVVIHEFMHRADIANIGKGDIHPEWPEGGQLSKHGKKNTYEDIAETGAIIYTQPGRYASLMRSNLIYRKKFDLLKDRGFLTPEIINQVWGGG